MTAFFLSISAHADFPYAHAAMYIYIDESGSFVHAPGGDSWSVVIAFAIPEAQLPKLQALMLVIRDDYGDGGEVKLKSLSEARYIRFLKDLSKLGGIAFATAVDLHAETPALVALHRDQQAEKIVKHVDKMEHAAARQGLMELANKVRAMPEQLYIQLQAQIGLFHRTVARSSLYYAQHKPEALEFFRWRIDQKNTKPTAYDNAFELMLPAVIQTMSFGEPLIQLVGADYSYFDRFEFAPGEQPTYLTDEYGLPPRDGIDLGKIIREDFKLVDSATEPGIQVADLLASGTRRLLRGGFERAHEVALLLGANLLSTLGDENIIEMISLAGSAGVSSRTAQVLGTLSGAAKPLLVREKRAR